MSIALSAILTSESPSTHGRERLAQMRRFAALFTATYAANTS